MPGLTREEAQEEVAVPQWLVALPIETVSVLVPSYVVGALLVLLLLVPVGVTARHRARWMGVLALGALLGAGAGQLAVWWVADVQDVFGVTLSGVVDGAVVALGAAIGLVVVNLVRTRWWRKGIALLTIPSAVVCCALIVNVDIAYFPRLGDALGLTGVHSQAFARDPDASSLASWRPPKDLPRRGTVGSVDIPATRSHFDARPALVYLPPAARVSDPPRLPVVVALSGQPGTPADIIDAGGLGRTMDAIAAEHRGVAPIVVVPDQLGPAEGNPMCVDSPLGHVATYLTVDVPHWIRTHLPAARHAREWTIAGFSEGGTCAIQLAAAHPGLFGSLVDVAGEIAPADGSVAETISSGFAGDAAAYRAATPAAILRAHGPYADSRALFAVGADDVNYAWVTPVLAADARRARMLTSTRIVPGAAHNWTLATAGLAWGMRELVPWWGLHS